MTLHVTSTQQIVPCPVCAVFTARVHSRYTRTLADLPWGVARVRWQLRVRKFICTNAQCPRRGVSADRLYGFGHIIVQKSEQRSLSIIAS
jgi:transposase